MAASVWVSLRVVGYCSTLVVVAVVCVRVWDRGGSGIAVVVVASVSI